MLPPDHPKRVRFKALTDWMDNHKADYNKLKLRFHSDYDNRGLHATKNIKRGETVLFVPKHLIITHDLAL